MTNEKNKAALESFELLRGSESMLCCIKYQPSDGVRFAPQKGLLEVLYEIFRLPVPIITQDFTEALLSVGE